MSESGHFAYFGGKSRTERAERRESVHQTQNEAKCALRANGLSHGGKSGRLPGRTLVIAATAVAARNHVSGLRKRVFVHVSADRRRRIRSHVIFPSRTRSSER